MKTILDVTVCVHSKGGVGRWVNGLSKGLFLANPLHASMDVPETHPSLITDVPSTTILPPPFWMSLPLLRRLLFNRGMLESTRASRIEKCFGVPDIIHLSGVQPEGRGRKKVVTFFDDTPWVSPESHTPYTLKYAGRLKNLIDNGASVLAISDWAAATARSLFNLPEERTGSAGGAADEAFTQGYPDSTILAKYNLKPSQYFLHVGSYVPRKNIPFLIKCFSKAKTGKKLVLAGAESWGDPISDNTEGVVFLSNVSDYELLSLYRGAVALLLPSSREGLGLPVLEALACKLPVIASDGGALPETVGKYGLILPALENEPWIKTLTEISNGSILDNLRTNADLAPKQTWKNVGERAMTFYRSLK